MDRRLFPGFGVQRFNDGYAPPVLASISPTIGDTTGGNLVTCTFTSGLSANTNIIFGKQPAYNVTITGVNTCTCITPPNMLGLYNVAAVNSAGNSILYNVYNFWDPVASNITHYWRADLGIILNNNNVSSITDQSIIPGGFPLSWTVQPTLNPSNILYNNKQTINLTGNCYTTSNLISINPPYTRCFIGHTIPDNVLYRVAECIFTGSGRLSVTPTTNLWRCNLGTPFNHPTAIGTIPSIVCTKINANLLDEFYINTITAVVTDLGNMSLTGFQISESVGNFPWNGTFACAGIYDNSTSDQCILFEKYHSVYYNIPLV